MIPKTTKQSFGNILHINRLIKNQSINQSINQ
jgi:hypothetical protein